MSGVSIMDMVAPWDCERRCSLVRCFEARYFEDGCDSCLAAADQTRGLCCVQYAGSPRATRPPALGCRRSIRESWQKAGAPFRRARGRVSIPETEADERAKFFRADFFHARGLRRQSRRRGI